MTGRAGKDLAGRMEQAASRSTSTTAESGPAPTATATAAPRAKPVRLSVDLAPAAYRGLIDYCHQSAEELGVARVNGVDVLRALLAELAYDGDLAARVRARIARN